MQKVEIIVKKYLRFKFFSLFWKASTDLPSTKETAAKFRKFYEDRTQKEIDSKKSDKGKEKYQTIQKEGLKFIDNQNERIYFACATYKTLQRIDIANDIG